MSSDPTVTSVVASGPGITTSTETGNLNVGAVVTFTVDMSAPVTVSGTPSFTLNDNGGVATYMSGSGSNALIFGYTVAAGQDTPTTGTPGLAITGYVANGATVSSGNPTITPGSGQTLVASDGTFSFGGATGGGNYVILRNGSQYASGAAVLLELVNGVVWAEAASNQWYDDNGANWSSSTTAPPSGGTVQTASLTNLNTFAFPNLVIDTTTSPPPPPPSGPTVTSVVASGPGITTSTETGNLNVGAVVTFTVDMSAPVTVSGTPSFTLNDNGGVATYMSGSGSNALIFGYTVAAGQDTPTTGTPGLAITGYNANGATVSSGNPTITPGSGQTLVASDGTFSFGGATGGGNYVILRNGSQYASGAAALLELVNTTVWAETASNQWYEDNGANWSSSTTAPPSGGTVQTASLTNLNTFAFPNLVINTTSPPPPSGPTVTSVVASGPGITTSNETGDLNVGAVVTFTVDMSAPVTVSGTPSFTLNDNGGVATYMSGSGSNALIFGYTVAAGQDTPTTGTPGLAITGYVANGATVSTGNPTITPGSGQTLVASDGTFSFGGATGGGNYVILRNGSQYASGAAVLLELVNGVVWAETASNQWYDDNGANWSSSTTAPPSGGTVQTASLTNLNTFAFPNLVINTTSPPPPSGPTVTSVVASGPGITTSNETGDLNVGAVVTFTVDMSAPVTVSGTPSFTLNDNGGVATYMSGSGSNALIFGYTVAAGQDTPTTGTPGLAITGYNANGATVSTGNPTITPGSGQTLVASDGTFSFGGATGGGNYVILRNGSQYASGAAALLELVNTTVWAETASNQWYEDNGSYWTASSTAPPSGGTVQTASLTNLNTFAFPNLVIDTTTSPPPPPPSGPTVTSVVASGPGITTSTETGNLNVGAVVTFTVDMSAPVTVSGTPSFTLNDNGGVATYMSGSGSNALIFGYTVAAGQDTPTTGTPGLAITGYNANGATVSSGNPTITPGSGQTLVASDGTFSFGGATGGGNYVILRNGSQYASGAAALLELVNTTVWAETASNQWYEDNGSYWTASSTAPPSGGTVQTASLTNLNTFAFPNLVINTTTSPPPPPPSGPTVTSVVASGPGITTSNETGDLNIGAVITFTVKMSGAVTVTGGPPTLSLSDNGVATYTGGSDSTALTFSYTVAAGENATNLGITAFNPNGANVTTAPTTVTPGSGLQLTDANGNVFIFGGRQPGSSNYIILRNGTQYASGAAVLLALVNGVVWAETASNQWYEDNGSTWVPSSTAPTISGIVETANLSGVVTTFTGLEIATAETWANEIGGTWQKATNWNPAAVPDAETSVLIVAPGTYTVTDSQSTTVYSITTAGGTTLDITGGIFTAIMGTWTGTNAGNIKVESAAALDFLPSTVTNTGTLQNASGGTINFVGTTVNGGMVTNSGSINVTGGEVSSFIGTSVNNTGVITTTANALALDGNGIGYNAVTFGTPNGYYGEGTVTLTTTKPDDVIILLIHATGATSANDDDDQYDADNLDWHFVAQSGSGTNHFYEYYAIAPNPLSADAISVIFTGSATNVDLNAFAISGANTSAPFDANPSVPAVPANSTGSITTTNANDFIFAAYNFATDATPAPGIGWTPINSTGGNYLSEYQIVSTTQTGLVATASSNDEDSGIVDAVVQGSEPTAAIVIDAGSTLNLNATDISGSTMQIVGTADVTGGSTSILSGVGVSIGSLALDGNAAQDQYGSLQRKSITATLTTAQAGDVIIVFVYEQGAGVGGVSDDVDLAWNQRAVASNGTSSIFEYYAIAPAPLSADSITVQFMATATYAYVNAFGISGADTASPFDSKSLPATPVASTGSVTTSNPDDFIFASYGFASTLIPNSGSGWNAINATGGFYLSEYQIVSASQTGLVATASRTDEVGGIVDAVVQAPGLANLKIDAGSVLDLNGSSVAGGTLNNEGTVTSTGTTVFTGVAVNNSGTFQVTGGSLTATAGSFIDNGNLQVNSADLDIGSSVTASASSTATLSGSSAILEFGAGSNQNTAFAGANDVLKLDLAQSFSGTVAGLADGDGIDLANFQFSNNPTISSVTGTGNTGSTTNVTVTDNSLNVTLHLINQVANQFAVNSNAYSISSDSQALNPGTLFQLAPPH